MILCVFFSPETRKNGPSFPSVSFKKLLYTKYSPDCFPLIMCFKCIFLFQTIRVFNLQQKIIGMYQTEFVGEIFSVSMHLNHYCVMNVSEKKLFFSFLQLRLFLSKTRINNFINKNRSKLSPLS